jgi:hypothetical protein
MWARTGSAERIDDNAMSGNALELDDWQMAAAGAEFHLEFELDTGPAFDEGLGFGTRAVPLVIAKK